MLDQQRLRRDTPGCLDKVFLDSAGSSLSPEPVLEAVIAHLRREAEIGGYLAAGERTADLADVKTALGELLGAQRSRLRAGGERDQGVDGLLLRGAARRGRSSPDHRGRVRQQRHRAPCSAPGRPARVVEVVPSTPTGEIDLDALSRMLDERVRLVSLVHAPTNGGLINPVREVVDLAHGVGALVLLDACQSVGQIPVRRRHARRRCALGDGPQVAAGPAGHRIPLRAPRTGRHPRTRRAGPARRAVDGDRRLPAGRGRVAVRVLGVQCRGPARASARRSATCSNSGIDEVSATVAARAEAARAGLATVPGVTVRDLGRTRSGIVSFTVDGVDPGGRAGSVGRQGHHGDRQRPRLDAGGHEQPGPGGGGAGVATLLQLVRGHRAARRGGRGALAGPTPACAARRAGGG